jgi:hypothetical protein
MSTKHYNSAPEEKPLVVNDPIVAYGNKTSNLSFEEDFNKALATAITVDEFKKKMDDRIDAWPWKEKLFSPMK